MEYEVELICKTATSKESLYFTAHKLVIHSEQYTSKLSYGSVVTGRSSHPKISFCTYDINLAILSAQQYYNPPFSAVFDAKINQRDIFDTTISRILTDGRFIEQIDTRSIDSDFQEIEIRMQFDKISNYVPCYLCEMAEYLTSGRRIISAENKACTRHKEVLNSLVDS